MELNTITHQNDHGMMIKRGKENNEQQSEITPLEASPLMTDD